MVEEQKNKIGWVMIALILFSIVKNFAVVIYFQYKFLKQQFLKLFNMHHKQIDSPHTSDDGSNDSVHSEDLKEEDQRELIMKRGPSISVDEFSPSRSK